MYERLLALSDAIGRSGHIRQDIRQETASVKFAKHGDRL
jgi:hypothetical protein